MRIWLALGGRVWEGLREGKFMKKGVYSMIILG